MGQSNWAPEHSDALRDHVCRGMTFSDIVKAINLRFDTAYTRSAVIGRALRMKLVPPARSRPRPLVKPMLKRFMEPRQTALSNAESDQPASSPVPEPAGRIHLRCAGVEPRHLSLVDLEPADCRYPYGGDSDGEPITFCGHPRQPGSSYCTPHFHLSRNPELLVPFTSPAWLRLLETA